MVVSVVEHVKVYKVDNMGTPTPVVPSHFESEAVAIEFLEQKSCTGTFLIIPAVTIKNAP